MRFFISLHFRIHIIDLSDIQQIQLADIDSFLILGKMSLRRIVPHMLIRSLLKQCIDVPVDIPLDHVIVQAGLCQLPLNMPRERFLECLQACRLKVVELEVDDGVSLPLPVSTVDVEALEQLAPPGEERLQGGYGERLSKPSRTRNEEEVCTNIRDKTVDEPSLVNVDATLLPQLREIVRVCGYRFHRHILYQKSLSPCEEY